ncbi:MAG: phosphoenolpyruvate--protein phosphotransferase [Halobacteriovorax sp.]|nr:phosphoenolpyruvate--protein phosphotransferase [Halobacteriovorax sp.]
MNTLRLKSPLSGVLVPIENVPDEVFAKKMVGDGVGIDPTGNTLTSPCHGKIVQLHESRHAITVENENGQQILLHIGIDTVNLKGQGFKAFVNVGEQVVTGQKLIEFDQDLIVTSGLSLVSVMVFIEGQNQPSFKIVDQEKVISGETSIANLEYEQKEEVTDLSTSIDRAYESVPFFVRMPSGMHARPAAKLAEIGKKFSSSIEIIKGNKSAPISSIISVLGLEIAKDDEIIILAIGSDCQQAVKEVLSTLVKIEEDELESFNKDSKPTQTKKLLEVKSDERTLVGTSASDGVVIGVISKLGKLDLTYSEKGEDPDAERLILENAIIDATNELNIIENKLSLNEHDAGKAAIFSAHIEMLQDPELLEESVKQINSGYSAAHAWDKTIKHRAQRLEGLKNELIAGRANDLRDIGGRVLKKILGIEEENGVQGENVILVAEDLTPSDTIKLDRSKVLGFCTTSGGATSHVAILARSMGIPAIAGIENRVLDLKDGEEVILDGEHGALYLSPTSEEKENVLKRQEALRIKKEDALEHSMELAQTKDGHRIEVVANISGVSDALKAVEVGGEGVGLLRTEFLFLDRDHAPTEEEQHEIYQGIADALGDRPLIIRTLDIGGDKALNYMPMPEEENPFLGVRGIRLCFQKEEIFREQLRAILKVKSSKPIHIMFPMIGQMFELIKAKKILEEERLNLNAPIPKVGMMIEVPSAAVMAEQFAKEVDFFSIGTNDLTQYTMAMDRGHNELAKQVDGLHPAVLNLIAMTADAAHRHGKWVGVCGGIASETKAIPVLLSLGVDELSLSIPNIPMIKASIRELKISECKNMRQQFLSAKSGKEVREIVLNNWPQL